MLLQTRSEPAVHRGPGRRREISGQRADIGCRDATTIRNPFGGEAVNRILGLRHAIDVGSETAEVDETFIEEHVGDRGQHQRVGAGPDVVVSVGGPRRLGEARVDGDDAPAARPHRLGLTPEIGHAPHAGVRGDRVGTDDHEQVAALDVGYRHRVEVTEHLSDRQVLGHLIERSR